jgi:hypothetical protein
MADLLAIWAKHRPRGYRVIWCDDLTKACADKPRRTITCPKPTTPLRLAYALHEAWHIRLDPWRSPPPSDLVMEYETERYTLLTLELEGVEVTPQIIRHCKANVRKYLPGGRFWKPGTEVPKKLAEWAA